MGRPRALKSLTERGRLRVRFLAAAAAAAAAAVAAPCAVGVAAPCSSADGASFFFLPK